ncbi:MAG: dihydropyrimidinase [Salinivirgaceae bacterium]
MKYLLVKNGLLIDAHKKEHADLLIGDGKILQRMPDIQSYPQGTHIIDAKNNYVIPGGIDPHVHFHLVTTAGYSADNFYSGSKAALAGGTTTIIDFITPKANQTFQEAFPERMAEANNCLCDYAFHISPIYWDKTMAKQMEFAVNEAGINSFKVYMAYKQTIGINTDTLRKVMEQAAKLNVLVTIHAEDGDAIDILQKRFLANGQKEPYYHALSRPASVEANAVKKAIDIAAETGASIYFVHISAAESVKYIAEAQKKGMSVYAETCPQYLMFTHENLKGSFEQAAPFVFSPALKDEYDKKILWNALSSGIIKSIGTDHCPFNLFGQKNLGKDDFTKIPNGTGGVEYRLTSLFTHGVLKGIISLEQWVALTSAQVAKIFGLKNKGELQSGFDADVVIWNPKAKFTATLQNQWQQCDSSIYEGLEFTGKALMVIKNGKIVFENNEFQEIKGSYIKR